MSSCSRKLRNPHSLSASVNAITMNQHARELPGMVRFYDSPSWGVPLAITHLRTYLSDWYAYTVLNFSLFTCVCVYVRHWLSHDPCRELTSMAQLVRIIALLGCVPLFFHGGDAAVTPFLRGTETQVCRIYIHIYSVMFALLWLWLVTGRCQLLLPLSARLNLHTTTTSYWLYSFFLGSAWGLAPETKFVATARAKRNTQ